MELLILSCYRNSHITGESLQRHEYIHCKFREGISCRSFLEYIWSKRTHLSTLVFIPCFFSSKLARRIFPRKVALSGQLFFLIFFSSGCFFGYCTARDRIIQGDFKTFKYYFAKFIFRFFQMRLDYFKIFLYCKCLSFL